MSSCFFSTDNFLFVSADEEYCFIDEFFPCRSPQNSIAHLRKVTYVHRRRCFEVKVVFDNWFLLFLRLLPKDNFFSLHNFINFPIDLLPIFVIASQIRSNVGDYFSWLVLLNETQICKDIENFLHKILRVKVFLLHHEVFSHFLNAAFGGCLFFVD